MSKRPTLSGMDIRAVIKAAGGPSRLAKHLGLSHSTVLGWRTVPPAHARKVADATGIPLHELRPDLWEPPPSQDAA